ncbi:PIN domain-like protein [Pelagophyceae sp. CCMP2097]|nr:PIN domain-like protein [Pelagophyceae sp. CCMP2097]
MTIDGQFWSVVEAGECVGADDVRGLKLAVDLSIWLVEAASSAALAEAHAKPHLFLVFSRAVFLLKRGCRLVCVLDGERDPRKRWRDGRGNGASGSRRRLDDAGREAALLLHGLGVPTFVASGEAEAMCARLQLAGLVDGVVTEDGDAFAYGAAAVYRDFTVGALRAGRARVYRLGADSSLCPGRAPPRPRPAGARGAARGAAL